MSECSRYFLEVQTDSELYWSAGFFCGLFQLVEQGVAAVRFVPSLPLCAKEIFATAFTVTDRETGVKRSVSIDWRDNADLLCLRKLAACDVYFKRNFIPELTFAACPDVFRVKLRPAGLFFATRTSRERPLWAQLIGGLCSKDGPIIDRSLSKTLRRLHKALRGPINVKSFLRIDDFEANGISGSRNVVLFQTRAYDPRESSRPEDTRRVTEQRAEIIRALKAEFGDKFVGGFTPIPYALQAFPDCVSNADAAQSAYARSVKSASICIYTRGLRDSPAFKFGEYLASGRCIVAEELKTVLPTPLVDGEHVLFFRTANEVIERCRRLFRDEGLQVRLSARARAYYEAEVKPDQRVRAMLEQSCVPSSE